MTWRFCPGCVGKGPIPGCPLCEKANGRPMTAGEEEELTEAIRAANARTWPLPDDWWLDVPYEDGTTPRERQRRAP